VLFSCSVQAQTLTSACIEILPPRWYTLIESFSTVATCSDSSVIGYFLSIQRPSAEIDS
jgi:hypothetical protein